MDTTLIIGITGASLILLAFFLNQTGKWSVGNVKYDFLNGVGSLLMVIYAVLLDSIPFLILNAVWALVSLKDVFKYLVKRNS